jgi:general secretion pathway protein M
MIGQLWNVRSPRERGLLAIVAVLVAGLVAWYGVALPLRRVAVATDAYRARAIADMADAEWAAKAIGALPDGGIEEAVMASAEASGIMLDRKRMENAREITVWVKDADPGSLFGWLQTLQKAHGVVPSNLTATRDGEGVLDVEIRLLGGAG